jgi:hypothetical protein
MTHHTTTCGSDSFVSNLTNGIDFAQVSSSAHKFAQLLLTNRASFISKQTVCFRVALNRHEHACVRYPCMLPHGFNIQKAPTASCTGYLAAPAACALVETAAQQGSKLHKEFLGHSCLSTNKAPTQAWLNHRNIVSHACRICSTRAKHERTPKAQINHQITCIAHWQDLI